MVSSKINWQVSQTQQENQAEVLCFSALRQCFALIPCERCSKKGFLKLKELLDQLKSPRTFTSFMFTKSQIHCRYCKCRAFRENVSLLCCAQHFFFFYACRGNRLSGTITFSLSSCLKQKAKMLVLVNNIFIVV